MTLEVQHCTYLVQTYPYSVCLLAKLHTQHPLLSLVVGGATKPWQMLRVSWQPTQQLTYPWRSFGLILTTVSATWLPVSIAVLPCEVHMPPIKPSCITRPADPLVRYHSHLGTCV